MTVIDADPNHPIAAWRKGSDIPANLAIVDAVDEDNILDRIEEAAAATPFVVMDLEGTAAKIVLLAVSQADLVIVPMRGSQFAVIARLRACAPPERRPDRRPHDEPRQPVRRPR